MILRDNELVSSDFPICDGCAGNAGSVFTVVYNFELPTPCLCVSSYVDARWMSLRYQHCARLYPGNDRDFGAYVFGRVCAYSFRVMVFRISLVVFGI